MLPKGWTQGPLRESVRIHSGHAPSDLNLLTEGEIPYVKVEDLNNCEKYQTDSREYLNACRSVVPAQALIFPKRGAAIFANKIRIAARPLALDTNLMGVEVVSGLDPEYLYYAISFAGLHRLADTSTIPQLNNKHVLPHVLPRPSLKEQRRIAQILSTWDQAIATAERLIANSQRQRLGLTQTLISDRSRQARGMPTLPREHASAIFLPRSVRRNDGLELLSVMQDVGVVPRSSLDRKVVMPEGSTDGYKLVEPGDFVISLRSFEGGLEYSRFRGLVSPAYTVLMPAKSIVDDFYRHYFKSREFIGRLAVAVIGIRDGKQISYDDFEFLKLPYPPVEEQEAIAKNLNAAEEAVKRHERYLQLLRQEKTALMSQLLTGERRVKLPDAETEVQA